MEKADAIATLKSKIEATAGAADRLAYSIKHTRDLGLVPLTKQKLAVLDDSEMEAIDALIYRYGSLISNIQDALFKSIAVVEEEPVSTLSNRDKANLMERLGALPSSEEFSSLAIIRNKLMHDYPEEAQKQLDRLNFLTHESPRLVEIFLGIARYAEKFGLRFPIGAFRHLKHHAQAPQN